MQIFVSFEAFDTIIGDAEESRLRIAAGAQFEKILASGKVEASGIFADRRGGFLLLNVDSGEELVDLLGRGLLENFHVESHPVVPFDKLQEYFEKNPV